MADFVAVLRKTIGNLGENTPEMREKVYDKARSTIEAKLAALNPQPPAVVVERQRKALEDAIAVLRADYAEPEEPEQDDDLEDIFASLHEEPDLAAPPPLVPAAAPVVPARASTFPPAPDPQPAAPIAAGPVNPPERPAPAEPSANVQDPAHGIDTLLAETARPQDTTAERPRRAISASSKKGSANRAGLLAALLLLVAVVGGGYALWMNKDDLFATDTPPPPATELAQPDGQEEAVTTSEQLPDEKADAGEELASAPPAEPETTPTTQPEPTDASEKFTQRLMPDGSEVDEGPAGGQSTIGEGTSVASATPGEQATDGAAAPSGAAENAAPATETGAPAGASGVAVGQRAIFYEERTSSAQGSAELGQIVWSVVQESPGGDLPPEPAIRAEATIPDKDIQLRMTIRRNGDATLPASHIVEMIFLTPESFEGGSIANVSRISFKETEQAAGNPLIGIPAKIADGFFLLALGDSPAEIQANTTLLRQQNWLDIPIVYQSGRRALLSLEKGIPGEQVFQEALRAWEEAAG